MYEPYTGRETRGIEYHSLEDAEQAIRLGAEQGISNVSIHAIGDAGIDRALAMQEIWERRMQQEGMEGQARIEHMSVPRLSSIREAKKRGIIACPQPAFLIDGIPFAQRLGQQRTAMNVPLRLFQDTGLRTMYGTDGMPNHMVLSLACAVDALNPETQRVDLPTALHNSSVTAAEYEGVQRGQIAKGHPADFLLATNRMVADLYGHGLLSESVDTFTAATDALQGKLTRGLTATMRGGRLKPVAEAETE